MGNTESSAKGALRKPGDVKSLDCYHVAFGQFRLRMLRTNHPHLLAPQYPVAMPYVVAGCHVLKIRHIIIRAVTGTVVDFLRWRRGPEKAKRYELMEVELSPPVGITIQVNAEIPAISHWANRSRLGATSPTVALASYIAGLRDGVIAFVTRYGTPFFHGRQYTTEFGLS